LDFTNGLIYQGFTIPALATRRVATEIELSEKQSFAIAGLLDNRMTENLNKVPGLGDIPLLGKLFQSRATNKNKSELLVLVTPEIVNPIPAGQKTPDLPYSGKFMAEGAQTVPRTPGVEQTGPAVPPAVKSVPVEVLKEEKRLEKEQDEKRSAGSSSTQMSSGSTMTRGGVR
jgi:pilus assembly protein CpaC